MISYAIITQHMIIITLKKLVARLAVLFTLLVQLNPGSNFHLVGTETSGGSTMT